MLNIALYDDGSDYFLDLFEKTQLYFTAIDSKKYSISCFYNIEFLLAAKKEFDIYIIDVETGCGLKAGAEIHKIYSKAKIIYVCNDLSHVQYAYDNNVCAYLLKPVSVNKLYSCFDRILNTLKPKRALIPTSGLDDEIICTEEIAYIDIEGRNICFHFKDGSKVTSVAIRSAFKKEVERFIHLDGLFFATRTLLVNISYIKSLSKNKITFKNGQELYTTEKAIKLIKEEIEFR